MFITRRRRAVAVALAATAFGALGTAGSASAQAPTNDCYNYNLTDPLGFSWESGNDSFDGAIDNGTYDAYDTYGEFQVDDTNFSPDDSGSCAQEDGEREFVFGSDQLSGLQVTRKLYVPASGPAFARFLNTVTNPTNAPITVDLDFRGNLGSDGSEIVLGSENGDQVVDDSDAWVASDEDPEDPDGDSDPSLGHVADTTRAGAADALDTYLQRPDGSGNYEIRYDDVTIPAGATSTYMFVALQRNDRPSAVDDSAALAAAPADVFAGMSLDEGDQVRNWVATDFDGDGAANRQDNCLRVNNGDQANLDGDAEGDACDADQDNDGLDNGVEATFGTNPRAADSDGDGVNDRADGCPTRAGAANGCPAAVQVQVPVPGPTQTLTVPSFDRFAPKSISARVRRSGRRYTTSGTIVPPDGVSAAQACGFGRVSVQVKAGSNTISTRRVDLRRDCRFSSRVTFTAKQRYSGKRSLTFRVRFLGNQRLLPARARTVSARVPS